MKTLVRTLSTALASMLAAAACDSSPPPVADAAPPAWVELSPRERSVDANISGLQLTPDEKALAFCTYRNEVGFIDTATLQMTSKVAISASIPELANTGFCRMTKRGDEAYALFYPALGETAVAIARLSLSNQAVLGIWRVPAPHDALSVDFFQTFEGLADAGDGRLLLTASFTQKPMKGTELHFFDPATGEFSSQVYPSNDDVTGSEVVGMVAPGRVYGLSGSHQWILDLKSGTYTWIDDVIPKSSAFEVDEQRGLMLLGMTPSVGWDIRRTDTGALVKRLPYSDPAFDVTLRFLPGDRVAYLAAGSTTSYMSIMDTDDGRPVAKASFSGHAVLDGVVTADGKRIYAGGTRLIAEISVPDSL